MTHEQKPESAEFRTRRTITMTTAEYDLVVKDAEARGAAEQRRKEAEGIEEAKDEGANYVLTSLALLFGKDGFEIRDGSETWEGDVNATLESILKAGGLVDVEGDLLDLVTLKDRLAVHSRKDAASDPDDVTCALMDSQYVAGAKFGWNCGQDDDHASLHKMIEGRLRDRIEEGVSFSDRSKDKASTVHEHEQRRKDAEGVEPVGYVRPNMMEFFRQSKALFTSASIIPKRDKTHTEPLYTRPANVAALEARVKELEGALAKVSETDNLRAKPDYHRCPVDQLAFELAWMCEEAELSANDLVIVNQEKLKTIARRVLARAAIREGGEHG